MVKVRMITRMAGPGFNVASGKERDVPPKVALDLVEGKFAELADPDMDLDKLRKLAAKPVVERRGGPSKSDGKADKAPGKKGD